MQHVIAWQYVIVNNTGVLHTMANIFVTLSKSRRHIAAAENRKIQNRKDIINLYWHCKNANLFEYRMF